MLKSLDHGRAFGSILQIVQDSFSKAHVERLKVDHTIQTCPPGSVVRFHAYNRQNRALHAKADRHEGFLAKETRDIVAEAVRRVVAVREREWPEVESTLNEIFDLVNAGALAEPGEHFKSGHPQVRIDEVP